MRDLFRNKKTLIPILLGIAIIIIAIVTFIVIGVTSKKSKSRVSVVKLDNSQSTTNELGNTYENKTDNNTTNETDDDDDEEDDEDKDFGIEEFYQEVAKKFVKGFADEDEIKDFVDEYFDPKAYVAYQDAELDDSKFLDEYSNLADDDERIEELTEKALNMPKAMKQAEELIRAMSDSVENTTMTDDDGNELDMSDIDFEVKLEDISEPEISEDDEKISKIVLTISMSGQELELTMVFYDEVVIYIMDSDEESFLDGIQYIEEE